MDGKSGKRRRERKENGRDYDRDIRYHCVNTSKCLRHNTASDDRDTAMGIYMVVKPPDSLFEYTVKKRKK